MCRTILLEMVHKLCFNKSRKCVAFKEGLAMTRQYVGGRSLHFENGDAAQLLYFLLSEKLEGCTTYGAEVVLHRDGQRESAVMRNLTTSLRRMDELLELLCRSTVTPGTLRQTVAEQLGENGQRHKKQVDN